MKTTNRNLGHGFRTNRQIARELNSHGWQRGRAFYATIPGVDNNKWTGARTRAGKLEICMCNRDWTPVDPETTFDVAWRPLVGRCYATFKRLREWGRTGKPS